MIGASTPPEPSFRVFQMYKINSTGNNVTLTEGDLLSIDFVASSLIDTGATTRLQDKTLTL